LEKDGGWPPRTSQSPQTVEIDGLPAAIVAQVNGLAAKLKNSGQPPVPDTSRARDAVTYTIVIEDKGQRLTFKQRDTQLTREFDAMLHWLEDYFKAQRRGG
jgi:hypothetical protein